MNPITEYIEIVDSIYGTYFDSTNGFTQIKRTMELQQSDFIRVNLIKNPAVATMTYLDSRKIIYGKGDPNNSKSYPLHVSTQKEFKLRNSEGGINFEFAGNMAIITIYHYWEDKYRNEISKFLNLKEDLKIPVFGDLRILRRSIVHHRNIALPDVGKCELLKWFSENDKIFFTRDMMETIVREIQNSLKNLL